MGQQMLIRPDRPSLFDGVDGSPRCVVSSFQKLAIPNWRFDGSESFDGTSENCVFSSKKSTNRNTDGSDGFDGSADVP